ncbi:hypothetical protein HanPSC8_Chr06g0241141 [Helianthus annuus]|nr:hypothetical protein HanPSC8_Chr06g0241141 [Helianthus annuus]
MLRLQDHLRYGLVDQLGTDNVSKHTEQIKVVRFLIMDLLSGSAGVVMDRDSWILVTLVLEHLFETID